MPVNFAQCLKLTIPWKMELLGDFTQMNEIGVYVWLYRFFLFSCVGIGKICAMCGITLLAPRK